MNNQDLGIELFDIRDYFNNTYVKEYKRLVIAARKLLKKKLKTLVSDGKTVSQPFFIKYMEDLLDKDYSYLYKETPTNISYDYNFVMDCFEYFDKNNIDELYTDKEIVGITTLGLMSGEILREWPSGSIIDRPWGRPTNEYIVATDEINDKIISTLVDFPVMKYPARHLNIFPKKSFMILHQDGNPGGRLMTILNYPNVDRTMEDGSLYRYFIPKRYEEENVKLEYDEEDWRYYEGGALRIDHPHSRYKRTKKRMFRGCNYHDILCNYTTVLVLNHMKHNDITGKVRHMITKNNSDKVRYGLYTQIKSGKHKKSEKK